MWWIGGRLQTAVDNQPWSEEAVVHVSIVNWMPSSFQGKRTFGSGKCGAEDLVVFRRGIPFLAGMPTPPFHRDGEAAAVPGA